MPDKGRVWSAGVVGAATAVRDVTRLQHERYAELQSSWPELWDKLEHLFNTLDRKA